MENENKEIEQSKQNKIEQIKKFCADLDPDIKVLIVGAGTGEVGRLIKAMDGTSTPLERMRLIGEHNAFEASAGMITEAMIRKMYNTDQLCVIVEDAHRVLDDQFKTDRTYILKNPYKDMTYLVARTADVEQDPKKNKWDKPKFMGDAGIVPAYRKNGNNRKNKKRKKAKNGKRK